MEGGSLFFLWPSL